MPDSKALTIHATARGKPAESILKASHQHISAAIGASKGEKFANALKAANKHINI